MTGIASLVRSWLARGARRPVDNPAAEAGGRRRVVVVGGGFAGVQVVRGLRDAPVDVTLVDRQNFTLFQPLVYQVAAGALSPAEIATPLRALFRRQRNTRVVLGHVTGFDLARREVQVDRLPTEQGPTASPTTRSSWREVRATPTSATTSGGRTRRS